MSIAYCNRCAQATDLDYNAEDVFFTERECFCLQCAEQLGYLCSKCGEEISRLQKLENGDGKGWCTDCLANHCGYDLDHDCHLSPEDSCDCQDKESK